MKRMIKGYLQETDFANSGAGTATWCIASKDGKKYFIKSFLEITLLDEETAKNLPAPMVEAKRKSCIQFRIRKERLYNKLNEIQNGIFVSPKELLVYNGHFCAVTEYIESFEEAHNIHKFSPRRKTILMRTIVLALKDLSDNHIVHSDLKPDNIIITYNQKKKPQLKIIDFDSGFFEDSPPHNVNEYHGDMVYFAPESMVFMQAEGESDIRLTCAVDRFAMGLILHQMWCGMLPEYDKNECTNVAEALLLDKPIALHGSIPSQLKRIINGFLQEDPDKRMTYDLAYSLLGTLLETLPEDKPEEEQPKPPMGSDIKTNVKVICVDTENGKVIHSTTLTIAAGHELAVVPKEIDGYKCMDEKCLIRVDAHGHADHSTVKFHYKKKTSKAWIWIILAIVIGLLVWYASTGESDLLSNLFGNGSASTHTATATTRTSSTSSPRNTSAPTSNPTPSPVSTGNNTLHIRAGEITRVKFTAPSAGTYVFTSTGSEDTYGYLYNSANTSSSLTSDDDSGSNQNFSMERSMNSGQTIYVGVKFYSSEKSGNTVLNISKKEQIQSVNIGNNTISISAGKTVRVSFTASSAGKYSFTTIGSADTFGYLYTSTTGGEIASDDDSGTDRNFKLERNLSANETIYIGVKYYDSSASGSISLRINKEIARTFELSTNISMNKGRATVSWTDSANNSPYEVAFECVGSGSVTHPSYWAGGDQVSSTTYSKSFTIDHLIPGKTYIIKITDCNNQRITKTYTVPSANTFVDGKLTASSISISLEPRYKTFGASDSSASSISQLRASTIMSNINSKEYGFRFDINYPQLAYSRTYYTQIAIIAPNGYTECEVHKSVDYERAYSGQYYDMIGEWTFAKIYEFNSTIPSGTWTVELYWDGMFVKRSTFTVQ